MWKSHLHSSELGVIAAGFCSSGVGRLCWLYGLWGVIASVGDLAYRVASSWCSCLIFCFLPFTYISLFHFSPSNFKQDAFFNLIIIIVISVIVIFNSPTK